MRVFAVLLLYASTALALPTPPDIPKATLKLRDTAVMVNSYRCTGSASIVEGRSGKHYVLSNQHVCNCAGYKGYLYATKEGGELIKARIVKRSWAVDLCAARVEDDRPALKLAPQLLPFSRVRTRGYPGGRLTESEGETYGVEQWSWTVPIQEVGVCPTGSLPERGLSGRIEACTMTFTSTISNLYGRPGSSGSAVVNEEGELVGVLSSWMPGNDLDSGMVTFEQTRKFLETL